MQVTGDTNHTIILRFDTALTVSIRRMHLSDTGEEVSGRSQCPRFCNVRRFRAPFAALALLGGEVECPNKRVPTRRNALLFWPGHRVLFTGIKLSYIGRDALSWSEIDAC